MCQRRAWQWWQTRQMLLSAHQADVIRDGLLQQAFALRRYLESSREVAKSFSNNRALDNCQADNNKQAQNSSVHSHLEQSAMPTCAIWVSDQQAVEWIDRFESIYHALENLSNMLSPPYMAENLPLALQFVLNHLDNNQFGRRDWPPNMRVQLCCDSHWPYPTPNKNRLVVPTVVELLDVLAIKGELQSPDLKLTLNSRMIKRTLTFQLDNCERTSIQKITKSAEIRYLKEVFHSLTAGRLEIIHEGTSLIGQLSWYDA